ncbi:MAG: HDOD domain-containing protein [Myxococcota bacterium]|nr:HDOD domain-containing protein [Myxococcota bacterium]
MGLLKRGRKLGKSKGEEGYGQGKASIAADDDVLLDEESMAATLIASLEAPDYQPPTLPAVAMELMDLSRRPDVEIDDVVALLEQDGMIAGRVLKLVQSPIYAGAAEVRSLREALMRVGLNTLRDIVMQIVMNLRVFRSKDHAEAMELLRRHSTMTAHLTKVVCKHAAIGGEDAFLAGLLHDVGVAGTLLALSEKAGRGRQPDLIAIWPALDRVHARAGEIMATHWELSAETRTAIAAHHQVMVKGEPDPLAACVAIADELAHETGYGVVPKSDGDPEEATATSSDFVSSHTSVDRSSPKTLEHAWRALEIDEATMERIRTEAAALASPFGESD